MPTVTSVVIVDHHLAFGERLQTFLRDQLQCMVIGLARDAAAGLELMRVRLPDFALIEVGLPGENGFRLADRLATLHPPVRVVLLGDDESADYVRAAADVGAIAYLPKMAVSQRLPALLGTATTGPALVAAPPKKPTSRRGLVLEGALAGGTLVCGLALNEPVAAIAGAGGIFLLSQWHSARDSRSSRTGASAPTAASASRSHRSGRLSRADGIRGSPERSADISDPS